MFAAQDAQHDGADDGEGDDDDDGHAQADVQRHVRLQRRFRCCNIIVKQTNKKNVFITFSAKKFLFFFYSKDCDVIFLDEAR